MDSYLHKTRTWIVVWFIVSNALVIWDCAYVLNRPHTFKGGNMHYWFQPYAKYMQVDYIYGWPAFNAKNGFTSAQAAMNIIETALNFLYLWLISQRSAISVLVGFSAVLMTVSKTVLYLLNEHYSGYANVGHNDTFTLIFFYIIPDGLWILVPSIIMWIFAADIARSLKYAAGQDRKPHLKSL